MTVNASDYAWLLILGFVGFVFALYATTPAPY